jgi:hypothetical protein
VVALNPAVGSATAITTGRIEDLYDEAVAAVRGSA